MSVYLSPKLVQIQDGLLMHWCPGCEARHIIRIKRAKASEMIWQFNGNFDKPTFIPSISLTTAGCHYFITDGNIVYCLDSKHKYAGKVVPLPDFPKFRVQCPL